MIEKAFRHGHTNDYPLVYIVLGRHFILGSQYRISSQRNEIVFYFNIPIWNLIECFCLTLHSLQNNFSIIQSIHLIRNFCENDENSFAHNSPDFQHIPFDVKFLCPANNYLWNLIGFTLSPVFANKISFILC